MVYILVEVRNITPPILTQINSIEVDDLFVENMDEETEMLLRCDGLSVEIYNVHSKSWKELETV